MLIFFNHVRRITSMTSSASCRHASPSTLLPYCAMLPTNTPPPFPPLSVTSLIHVAITLNVEYLCDSTLHMHRLRATNDPKPTGEPSTPSNLETSVERKRTYFEKLLSELESYPLGSIVDELGVVILVRICVFRGFDLMSLITLIKGLF